MIEEKGLTLGSFDIFGVKGNKYGEAANEYFLASNKLMISLPGNGKLISMLQIFRCGDSTIVETIELIEENCAPIVLVGFVIISIPAANKALEWYKFFGL